MHPKPGWRLFSFSFSPYTSQKNVRPVLYPRQPIILYEKNLFLLLFYFGNFQERHVNSIKLQSERKGVVFKEKFSTSVNGVASSLISFYLGIFSRHQFPERRCGSSGKKGGSGVVAFIIVLACVRESAPERAAAEKNAITQKVINISTNGSV